MMQKTKLGRGAVDADVLALQDRLERSLGCEYLVWLCSSPRGWRAFCVNADVA